jgi:cell division protein FtsW
MTTTPVWPSRDASARPAARWLDRPLSEPAIIFVIVLALITLGVLMVYSATRTAHESSDSYYFTRHIIFVPIALGALVLGAMVPYRRLNRWWVALGVMLLAVGLLAAVLFVGVRINGARRWIQVPLGFMTVSFQPSEFAKFAVVLFFAWLFSRGRPEGRPGGGRWARWWRSMGADPHSFLGSFVPAVAAIGLVCGLVLKEDFGTGAFVGMVAVALCLIAGWRLWFPMLLVGPAALAVYLAVWLQPWRLNRLKVWWDPWKYIDGPGWHICQSLMALGSGGPFGVGLGLGVQKLYIPENTTDFVFAVICEEMGLLGGLLVIGLFAAFVWRGTRIVRRAADRFGFLLASGILLVIGLQAIMNIGVVIGALPAKGISLPFISYGGSGLVLMSFAAGLLASVARPQGQSEAPAPALEAPPLQTHPRGHMRARPQAKEPAGDA